MMKYFTDFLNINLPVGIIPQSSNIDFTRHIPVPVSHACKLMISSTESLCAKLDKHRCLFSQVKMNVNFMI